MTTLHRCPSSLRSVSAPANSDMSGGGHVLFRTQPPVGPGPGWPTHHAMPPPRIGEPRCSLRVRYRWSDRDQEVARPGVRSPAPGSVAIEEAVTSSAAPSGLPALEPVREPHATSGADSPSSRDSTGRTSFSFLEDFNVPFDYFSPLFALGVVSAVLGFTQSLHGSPSLDAFSVDNLLHVQLPIQVAIFASVFLQAVAGWGFALAAIAGISIAAPGLTMKDVQALVALLAVVVNGVMFWPYMRSQHFDRKIVDKWLVAALVFTPAGVVTLDYVDEKSALFGMGVTILGYCAYATHNIIKSHMAQRKCDVPDDEGVMDATDKPHLSKEANSSKEQLLSATWGSGVLAGLLGGAFDAPGPPLVMFADITGMAECAELTRGNLFAFFALDSQLVAFSDLMNDRFDLPFIWPTLVLAMPCMLTANWMGTWCGKYVDHGKFRVLALALLTACGLHQVGAM